MTIASSASARAAAAPPVCNLCGAADIAVYHDQGWRRVVRCRRSGLRWLGSVCQPGRLLDVGPGTGIFLHLASKEFGWEPTGVDLCPESAVKAKAEFDIDLEVGDFVAHPWPPASFDAVTMLDVLEHAIDPSASLRRAF